MEKIAYSVNHSLTHPAYWCTGNRSKSDTRVMGFWWHFVYQKTQIESGKTKFSFSFSLWWTYTGYMRIRVAYWVWCNWQQFIVFQCKYYIIHLDHSAVVIRSVSYFLSVVVNKLIYNIVQWNCGSCTSVTYKKLSYSRDSARRPS